MNSVFDLQSLFPNEAFDFLGVKIPKYGSLTPNEQKALVATDDELSMLGYKCEAVKILLVSRCEGIEQDLDMSKLPIHAIAAAYEFLVNEINEWKPKEEADEEDQEKKAPTGQTSITNSDSITPTMNSGIAQSTSSESP